MSRVLVTGASGFLGRHLIARLLGTGRSILATCRDPREIGDLDHAALAVAVADVRDAKSFATLLPGVDTVFHLAGVRSRPGASPQEMTAVNEEAALRLVREASAAGVRRFVSVLTAQIFGSSEVPIDEAAPLRPERLPSHYAMGRARTALALRALVAEGAPVTMLCPTIVYGPDHRSRPNRVTSHVRRVLSRGFDVVLGGGDAPRDLVHVADVVTALLAAAERPEAVGEEILVTGEPISQRGLGELIARSAARRPPRVASLPLGVARASATVVDRALGYDRLCGFASTVETLGRSWCFAGDKARRVLDHQPRPVALGIEETVRWIVREDQR